MAGTNEKNYQVFSKSLLRVRAQLTDEQVALVHRKLALDALFHVVLNTPADFGHARGNWQVTRGMIAQGEIATGDGPSAAAGNQAIQMGAGAIAGIQPYEVVYLTNNVEYIGVLELGLFVPPDPGPSKDPRPGRHGRVLVKGGFSTQAPAGMLGPTLQLLEVVPL